MDALDKNTVDEFIAELKPKAKRYQLELDSDFLVCVRPDGSKQWLYANSDHRAKGFARVLGDVSDMNLSQAKRALHYARKLDNPTEQAFDVALDNTPDDAQHWPSFNDTMLGTLIMKHVTQHRGSLIVSLISILALAALLIWFFFSFRGGEAKLEQSSTSNAIAEDIASHTSAHLEKTGDKVAPIKMLTDAFDDYTPSANTPEVLEDVTDELFEDETMELETPEEDEGLEFETSDNFDANDSLETYEAIEEPLLDDEPAAFSVGRFLLTRKVENREPAGAMSALVNINSLPQSRLYAFSDLLNAQGQIAYHQWIYENQEAALIPFNVGQSARWRVSSNKLVAPGQWEVRILDKNKDVIKMLSFEVIE